MFEQTSRPIPHFKTPKKEIDPNEAEMMQKNAEENRQRILDERRARARQEVERAKEIHDKVKSQRNYDGERVRK